MQVRGSLIDSEVPDLGLDISADWRALFTDYFRQYLAGVKQTEAASVGGIATAAVTGDEDAARCRRIDIINRNLIYLASSSQSFVIPFMQPLWIREQIRV